MGVVKEMDYRYENINPNTTNKLHIDEIIAQAFVSKQRNNVDQFEQWASMSKASDKIKPLLEQYKINQSLQKESTKSLAS